jgi:predicted secreted protein
MKGFIRASLIAIVAAFSLPAAAQAQDAEVSSIVGLPPGQTMLTISATETVQADQDLLVAQLSYQAKNADPAALQDEINGVMKKAVEAAKDVAGVKVSTQQYYVYPVDETDPSKKTARTWRGEQGLELKSPDGAALLKLTGALQAMGLAVNGLSYTLSPEKTETVQDSLMEAAMAKLQAKAERAAAALGRKTVEMRDISVDNSGAYPQPMAPMRAMMAEGFSRKAEAPVAEPGQAEISLTVTARVLLKP